MKKCIMGFFMAWGMFLSIPCPCKEWDESARNHMLCSFPLIGILVGAVWALSAWVGHFLPTALGAVLCAVTPWAVSGFIHLDGYMDVCDAVLSRRDLETRQRILKDSRCGAFAVIGMVLLALTQWGAFFGASVNLWVLGIIPVASRACASLAVHMLRPMGSSQYAAMERKRAPVIWCALWMAAAMVIPMILWNSFAPAVTACTCWLWVYGAYRQLDGMSGDVSGFGLTLGELCGVLMLVLVR